MDRGIRAGWPAGFGQVGPLNTAPLPRVSAYRIRSSSLPRQFLALAGNEMDLLRAPRPYQRVTEGGVIDAFERWMRSLGVAGYQGKPWDWVQRRR